MRDIITFHNSKWYHPIWALLFALCLVLLYWRKREWKNGYNTFFWFIISAIVIIYCPLLTHLLIPRFLPSFAEYERLAWLFFDVPLVSYTIVVISKDFDSKRTRYLFISSAIILLMMMGSPDNREFFIKPQNQYKISQDAVIICDKLDKLIPEGSAVVCVQLDSPSAFQSGNGIDGNLYYGIRMYASRFRLRFKAVWPEAYSNEKEFHFEAALPADIDYYLSPKSDAIYQELERLDYKYVDESENYAIFRKQKKVNEATGL